MPPLRDYVERSVYHSPAGTAFLSECRETLEKMCKVDGFRGNAFPPATPRKGIASKPADILYLFTTFATPPPSISKK